MKQLLRVVSCISVFAVTDLNVDHNKMWNWGCKPEYIFQFLHSFVLFFPYEVQVRIVVLFSISMFNSSMQKSHKFIFVIL